MIINFRHKGLEKFFISGSIKGIPSQFRRKLEDILDQLNAAVEIEDMNYPGSDLHPLKGNLKGQWAIKISGNWRLVFRFEKGKAFDIDLIDYH
ncbi:MAG: type II toxin-antitoxin system mRNA interferase toxin, RelE/StbE family [Deltaproteobacteria bacterium]|nr:type II toxin-antitoxin system mRNA interferase toxin, RelE/StbE family [Deltaproteobacteria bacterium]